MRKKATYRILSLFLASAALILTGCQTSGPAASSAPEPSSTAAAEPEYNFLSYGQEGLTLNEKTAAVTVSGASVNDVKEGLFGANHSWRGDGYYIWDAEADAPVDTLLEQLKLTGVTHLRYPGGIEGDYFHWYETVGDDRTAQIDPFSSQWPTKEAYDGILHDVNFGPDEWMELSQLSDTALTIQLNAGNGTPEEAAEYVRYLLSKGANVVSFSVGNEVCMEEERVDGVTVTKTPQEYIDFYNAVYEALGEDAQKISLGCIGITPSHPLCKYRNWDKEIYKALADKIDFIDIHIGYTPYFVSDDDTDEEIVSCLMASSKWVRMLLDEELAILQANAGEYADQISIQINEWGALGGRSGNTTAAAVYMASFFNTVMAEPKVSSACYLPLLNSYGAANLIGARVDGEWDEHWDNAVTYVFRMYAQQIGREVLQTAVSGCDTFNSTSVGLIRGVTDVPMGEAAVYYDPETGEGSIFLINRSQTENQGFSLNLPFENIHVNTVTELWSEDPLAKNTYEAQDVVRPSVSEVDMTITNGQLDVETKPISVLKIDFTVG